MENEMSKEYKAYETVINSFTNPFRLFEFYGKLPIKGNREYNEALRIFQEWSHASIKKKLEKKQGDANTDLLDLMVQSNSDSALSTTELLHNIFLFFLAGHETTSGTLTSVLYFLSRHPDVQDKAREEVISLFGKSEPSFDDIKSLQYLNQVINEASRLLGPVPGVSRLAKEDCTLDGYFIPKGTFVICSFSNTHHDPEIWGEDVNQFNPDRWTPERVKERPNNSFNPFGAGARICLGQSFANLEMRMTLIKLLQKFKFGISTPEFIIPRAITVRPQPGFLLSISKLD